jgi:hypothetical protein
VGMIRARATRNSALKIANFSALKNFYGRRNGCIPAALPGLQKRDRSDRNV